MNVLSVVLSAVLTGLLAGALSFAIGHTVEGLTFGHEPSGWQRLILFLLELIVLVIGFVVVVQVRCWVGWIDPDECLW